jgi:hypothetical protein
MSQGCLPQEIHALDFGHALIADDDVGGMFRQHAARFTERRHCSNIIFAAERLLKEFQASDFVIDVEN